MKCVGGGGGGWAVGRETAVLVDGIGADATSLTRNSVWTILEGNTILRREKRVTCQQSVLVG